MKVQEMLTYFAAFYDDFSLETATGMLRDLEIDPSMRLRALSKGTKEKVS